MRLFKFFVAQSVHVPNSFTHGICHSDMSCRDDNIAARVLTHPTKHTLKHTCKRAFGRHSQECRCRQWRPRRLQESLRADRLSAALRWSRSRASCPPSTCRAESAPLQCIAANVTRSVRADLMPRIPCLLPLQSLRSVTGIRRGCVTPGLSIKAAALRMAAVAAGAQVPSVMMTGSAGSAGSQWRQQAWL